MSKLPFPLNCVFNPASWLATIMVIVVMTPAAAGELPVVSLTGVDTEMDEAGLDPGSFLVSRQGGDLNQALTVQLTYGGTAVALSGDYELPPSSVVLGANVESQLVELTPRGDNAVEGTETVQVSLQPRTDYDLGTETSTTLNIEDDPVVITITVTDETISEIGLDPAVFELSRSGGRIDLGISVSFAVTGTANRLADYVQVSGVNFASGQISSTVTIRPLADNSVEGDETITLTIRPSPSYTAADPDSVTFTLTDDAPIVDVSVLDADMSEAGLDPGTFLITRSGGGDTTKPMGVSYVLSGTATSLSDYQAMGGTVIGANELELQLDLVPQADSNDMEGDETIVITLLPAASYLLGPNVTATVTLKDLVQLVFLDGFEILEKSCNPGDAIKSGTLVTDGPVLREHATGLMWARCGLSGVYDTSAKICAPAPGLIPSSTAATLDDFNLGRAGDNAGFSDWRIPDAFEQQRLPQHCRSGQAVR